MGNLEGLKRVIEVGGGVLRQLVDTKALTMAMAVTMAMTVSVSMDEDMSCLGR